MGYKIEKLSQVIRFKVTQTLQREISDPRIGLITITEIKLAKDLSACKIGYSVLGGDADRSKCQRALDDATGFIQREVASALRTRRSPQLTFFFDESIAGAARISELLRKEIGEPIHDDPELRAPHPETEDVEDDADEEDDQLNSSK